MKKPPVTLENYETVYEYYRNYQPPRLAAKLGYRAMHMAFPANVHYARDAEAQIGGLLDEGVRLILSANHQSDNDQYVIAGLAHSQPVLRQLRGETFIPSKAPLFRSPALRRGVDIMGAIPAFRDADVRGSDEVSEETRLLQKAAKEGLLSTATYLMLERHKHMGIFPEGTRNTGDSTTLLKLRDGIAQIACRVSEAAAVAVVPVGVSYDCNGFEHTRSPEVVILRPIIGDFDNPQALMGQLQPAMENAVLRADNFSYRRSLQAA